MRNQFPGKCKDCGKDVAAGDGYFHKNHPAAGRKWSVRCVKCVAIGKQATGKRLSRHQREALWA